MIEFMINMIWENILILQIIFMNNRDNNNGNI